MPTSQVYNNITNSLFFACQLYLKMAKHFIDLLQAHLHFSISDITKSFDVHILGDKKFIFLKLSYYFLLNAQRPEISRAKLKVKVSQLIFHSFCSGNN